MRASWAALLIAPTSVFLSSGSPTRRRSIRAHSLRVTSSAMLSCSSSREPAQQTWPWLKKMPSMMPSTAWSRAASSNTMLADLPPSSSVRPVRVPASARWISLPTAVEPVNATLSTSARTSAAPAAPSPVMTFTTPGGRSASWQISASSSAVSGVVSAGFRTGGLPGGRRRRLGRVQDGGVAGGKRGRELPRRHQQREVPRHDLADHAARGERAPGERVLQLVRPARVGEEVRRGQRYIDVARLADRLAAVQGLHDRQLARALLDQPRDAEDVLPALERRQRRPLRRRGARGGDRALDVAGARERDLGERLLV